MKTNTIFRGIATALVTPMNQNGVDYERFGKFIDWQINQGINALVVCGTTGEAPTLTDEEKKRCISIAIERSAGRVPVIAGTGSNNVAHGIELSKFATAEGADALLVVTPYYNKATQSGLVNIYSEYAAATDKPIIVYNVPGRTGVNVEPTTYAKLAEIENIAAIKEANNDIAKIVETMSYVSGKMDLYSGNDDQIVPLLGVGAVGCISVLSNILPAETVEICNRYSAGDIDGALQLQFEYFKMIKYLFCETNPIPAKAAVSAIGFCENFLRSPMYPMQQENFDNMMTEMRRLGLI